MLFSLTGLSSGAALAAGKYAYGTTALLVGIESLGLPLPGETALISVAIYAGATHHLNIFLIVASAAAGAIVGDSIGFWLGRGLGFKLLLRYGSLIQMTPARIKLGQYLFMRHGGKLVFFGRFIALLRSFAAFLAGANKMGWPRFMVFNACGGIGWASLYGFAAFYFGQAINHFIWPVALGVSVAASVAVVFGFIFLRRHEKRLEQEAEQALPGPLAALPAQGPGKSP